MMIRIDTERVSFVGDCDLYDSSNWDNDVDLLSWAQVCAYPFP